MQSADVLSSVAVYTKTKQTNKRFVKKSSLTKISIDCVRLFHDVNLKNKGAIVIPGFLLYVYKFARVLVTGEKFITGMPLQQLLRSCLCFAGLIQLSWRP